MFYREKEFMEAESWVPKGWTTQKLKQIIESVKGRKPNSLIEEQLEGYLPYLSTGYLRSDEKTKFTELYESSILVEDGDLILLWDGSKAGEFFYGKKGVLSTTMVKLELKNRAISQRYLFYLLKSKETFLQSQTRGTGVPHVDRAVLESLSISLAPTQEQPKIAEVLSCVDSAIQKTDMVIAKTERLKKGLMQQLLTRSIRQKKFKDTNIGKLPQDWDVLKASELFFSIKKGIFDMSPTNYVKEGIPFLRVSDIVDDEVSLKLAVFITVETHQKEWKTELVTGDIVLSKVGTLNRIAVIPPSIARCNISQNLIGIKLHKDRVEPKFFQSILKSDRCMKIIKASSGVTTLGAIRLDAIKTLKVPVPPIDEQRRIVSILSAVNEKYGVEKNLRSKFERIKRGVMDLLLSGKVRIRVD